MTTIFKFSSLVLLAFITACGSTVQNRGTQNSVQSENQLSPSLGEELPATLEQDDKHKEALAIARLTSEANCNKSIVMSELILADEPSLDARAEALLLQAHCYIQQQKPTQALESLQAVPSSSSFRARVQELTFQSYIQLSNWQLAAETYYQMTEGNRESAMQIWQLLSQLDTETLTNYNKQISSLSPWYSLLLLSRSYSENSNTVQQQVRQWQQQHSTHPFALELPPSFSETLETPSITMRKVGVVLPLSGRRKPQGEAVKNGILAAKFSDLNRETSLHFIDSNLPLEDYNWEEFDILVGPLLKENVEQIQALVPTSLPMLALNQVDTNNAGLRENFYYSLAPEDEAKQIANALIKKGFTKPVIISSAGNSYQRMKSVFIQIWQEETGFSPEYLDFTERSTLRTGISDLLEISQSKRRIREIENLVTGTLHSSERNRRDIDAIVVLANASQTELINPIIESSISPFAEILPVYASSRSYSQDLDKNELRDLRNLTFLDIPWMLPIRDLKYFQDLVKELWPLQNDTQNRLFAMGYDAYNLIPHLRHMAINKGQHFQGLTGRFTLNELNQTERTLVWAQIQQEEVQAIEMD